MIRDKEIPVYLILGFLDSGKTKFLQNTLESVLYCHKHGMEAYQGGTCNETDISARSCVHVAMAGRPVRMLAKPGMGFDEGFAVVKNEMSRIVAVLQSRAER